MSNLIELAVFVQTTDESIKKREAMSALEKEKSLDDVLGAMDFEAKTVLDVLGNARDVKKEGQPAMKEMT